MSGRDLITTVEHAADATEPHPDAAEVRPHAPGAKKACKTKPGRHYKTTRELITTVKYAADATAPQPDAAEVRPTRRNAKTACKNKQIPVPHQRWPMARIH